MKVPLDRDAAELIAERFRALGDPTRLLILDHLRRHGEVAVGEIAARVGSSQQNTSKLQIDIADPACASCTRSPESIAKVSASHTKRSEGLPATDYVSLPSASAPASGELSIGAGRPR